MIKRTKERIKETGEVFTPSQLTNEMLDQLPPEMWEPDRTFLEPAAGDGNMLIEILKRKLSYGHTPVQALNTIYGIDLMEDNVQHARERMLEIVGNTKEHREIINKRIVQGNALNFDWGQFEENPLLEF